MLHFEFSFVNSVSYNETEVYKVLLSSTNFMQLEREVEKVCTDSRNELE